MKGWIIVKMIQPFAFVNSWTAKKESEQAGESEFARKFQGAGGTPGGLGMFIFGLALAIAGGYLIMNTRESANLLYADQSVQCDS
jgi:hypothetical protein